jgi:hypothetical protein
MPECMGLRVDSEWIQCVDKFPYFVYQLTIFLGVNDHVAIKRKLMFLVARSTGRLLWSLHQITNLHSIRTFFLDFVSSQQYGLHLVNFQSEDYSRAMKLFLQTIFCLPDSFPHSVVPGLLRIRPFEVTLLESRLSFIQRGLCPTSELRKILDFDSRVLRQPKVGFSHDLIRFLEMFFDVSDLEDLEWPDMEYLQDLRDQLNYQASDAHLAAFSRSTGLGLWTSLAEEAFLPREFGIFLGHYDLEIVRIVLLFLGDVFRFSLTAARSACPFCPIELHASHPFTCPNFPLSTPLPSGGSFMLCHATGVKDKTWIWGDKTDVYVPNPSHWLG